MQKSFQHAARPFRSQQSGAVTRMWRSCQVQPSQKEHAIRAVCCKKEGMLLQPPRWCCVECAIHHVRNACEEQHRIYVARTSNNRVISSGDLYCCLLPQFEALRTCRSAFPIATPWMKQISRSLANFLLLLLHFRLRVEILACRKHALEIWFCLVIFSIVSQISGLYFDPNNLQTLKYWFAFWFNFFKRITDKAKY